MARRARYVANNDSFGAFMRSYQIQRPTTQIAEDIATEAAMFDGTSIAADYRAEDGPLVIVAGNERVSARAVNDNEKAATYEFGSGPENEGATGANQRRQGGSSPARRHLGYIAAGHHDVLGEPG